MKRPISGMRWVMLLVIGVLGARIALAEDAVEALAEALVEALAEVKTEKAPHHGFRPQALVDDDGVLHVVQGDSTSRGDLFYLRRDPGSDRFSAPIPINTAPKIAAGFSMAVGKGGRVHVLIRPNPNYLRQQMPEKEKFKFWDLKYMLYCRMNDDGTAFEKERDLSGVTIGLEGVGPVLADGHGNVYAFWHGQLEPSPDESTRRIYRVVSTDAGKTFSQPEPVECEAVGACRCCSMSGLLEDRGTIVLAFRNATQVQGTSTKDSYLLVSDDKGGSFASMHLEPWKEAGCPGSTCTLASGPAGLFVGWRTMTKVMFAKHTKKVKPISPTAGAVTRVPVLAMNRHGVILYAWSATSGNRKGPPAIVWQLFDPNGKPISKKGVLRNAVHQKWGSFAAVAVPDGSFLILYDGPGAQAGD